MQQSELMSVELRVSNWENPDFPQTFYIYFICKLTIESLASWISSFQANYRLQVVSIRLFNNPEKYTLH